MQCNNLVAAQLKDDSSEDEDAKQELNVRSNSKDKFKDKHKKTLQEVSKDVRKNSKDSIKSSNSGNSFRDKLRNNFKKDMLRKKKNINFNFGSDKSDQLETNEKMSESEFKSIDSNSKNIVDPNDKTMNKSDNVSNFQSIVSSKQFASAKSKGFDSYKDIDMNNIEVEVNDYDNIID